MEVGFAVANGVPVFAQNLPVDLTLRHYVYQVPNVTAAVRRLADMRPSRKVDSFLIDPHASIQAAHVTLEKISAAIRGRRIDEAAAERIYSERKDISNLLLGPSSL